ncbi:MAG TPA: Na+/H+ antiporter subunit D [Gemmatimonadaceae bacterium]|nr:Na+/H+ antiporter subunit D [Gemmatimonadaceae bacterium]
MEPLLPVLPLLIPVATAIIALFAWRSRALQRWVGVGGAVALLAASIALLLHVRRAGITVLQAGSWPAPFGISIVADHLSAAMVLITGVMGLAVAVYSLADIDPPRERFAYYSLLHLLLAGVNGAFLTGDLFNLYVWFEVLLIASFVLLALGGTREQLDGALKYVAMNLVSSAFFLVGVGLLFGLTGTLNMADLSLRVATFEQPGLVTAIAMCFLVAFGIKSAVFPLFFWLPASYHTPPVAVSAIFAGLLTKVGVYSLIRVFTLIFVEDVGYTHTLILWIAGLTMVTGVLGAAAQHEIRRILSFHIVSQIGYMIMGLALFTPLALLGAVFYIIHHIIVKTNLFLVGGVVQRLSGSSELSLTGGMYRAHPWLAVLFLIPALSLAGIPPLSGFWAKLLLVRAGLEIESYVIVVVALLVGVLTLFSMTKIWAEAFWKPIPPDTPLPPPINRRAMALLVAPIAALAALTLTIGLWTEPFLAFAERAAAELMDPSGYVRAVLGEQAGAVASDTATPAAVTTVGAGEP